MPYRPFDLPQDSLYLFSHKKEIFIFYLNLSFPRVTQHWPEFGAQEGKEFITVADVMRHTQCIRIGVMEDNFDFGHILHFRHYKTVQLG